jgi:hypothetical protein
VLQLEGQL